MPHPPPAGRPAGLARLRSTRRVLVRSARALAAAALLALSGALALPAQAQEEDPMACTLNTAAGDLWCGVVTVGAYTSSFLQGHGFADGTPETGDLSDKDFTVPPGTDPHTIELVLIGEGTNAGSLFFQLTSALTAADQAKLVLRVDGSSGSFAFSDAEQPYDELYRWDMSGLDWSSETSVTLRLRGPSNNAPEFSGELAVFTLPENSAADTVVGTVTATDADDDTLTYSLEGTDAASFDIDSGTGEIKTKAGVTYNYEAKFDYEMTAKADDGNGGSDTIDVAIALLDDQTEKSATPAKPTLVSVPGLFTSLAARWTKPGLNGGPDIIGYEVEYRQGAGGSWTDFTHSGAARTTTITGLTADTEYQVRVRAWNGEVLSDWSDASDPVSTGEAPTPPTVTSVVVASAPQSGNTYHWGETIVFTVTFSDPVRVTGRPGLEVGLDNPAGTSGSTVQARFAGLSENGRPGPGARPVPVGRYVLFAYTVQPFDRDTDGVRIGADALRLASADRIQRDGTDVDADFDHAALGAQSGHRVDGRTGVDGEPAAPVAGAGITFVDGNGDPLETRADGNHRLSVPEGGSARYGLRLDSRPAKNVVLSFHLQAGDADLDVPRNYSIDRSIGPDEWSARTLWVRVEAAQDADAANGERVFAHNTASNDPNYHHLVLPDVVAVEADDDAGSLALSVLDAQATEGVDVTLDFTVRLHGAAASEVTVDYRTADGTATAGLDYTETSGMLTFARDETEKTVSVLIIDDDVEDDGETFTLVLSNASFASDQETTATGTIRNTEEEPEGPPLTASFEGVPAAHDGESAFRFRVAFSEPIAISFRSLREDAFETTGGRVTRGTRVDGRKDLFEITVEPDGDGELTIALPAGRDCAVSGAICTWGPPRKRLTNTPTATVAGPDRAPANAPAEGAPTIAGTPRVGGTLSASTSDISDADGLADASFAYQWMRTDTDIQGATGPAYTAVEADEGERLKVRVSFTDDAGNAESLTSAATDAVAARPGPLTASFEDVPAAHDGESAFTLRIASSDRLSMMNGRRLREDVVSVSGGRATSAGRVNRRRDLWRLRVEPDSPADVTVTLAAGAACGTPAAVCTKDGRALSNTISATVRGPVGIAVADARVEEGDGALLAFVVTLSRAASGTVTVDYATSDGSAHAGVDYRAASGTLTFRAGESSKTVEVAALDDSHDEGEETLTLRLSNASGARVTDGEATGTIKNTDPLPRALLARFGRTAAVHVVEHVEERLQAPREPGFQGRFAGREMRRGMERDMALGFLQQLGGAAGVHPAGMGGYGAMAGSPAVGAAPIGTPGRGGGGALMMGAGRPMSGAAGMVGGAAPLQTRGFGAAGFGGAAPLAAGPAGGPSGLDGGLNGGGFLHMGLGGGDLLTGSDFAMNRESRGGILSFWSRGAQSRFSGREGALSLGGDVRTTMFGADYARGPVVAGLSLSNSRGLGEYAGVAGGQVASSVTGLYPWLGYTMTERVTVWGVAGYGTGGLLLTPDSGQALESGLSMAMAAAGTRGELVAGGASGFELAFKADALWVGTAIDGVDGPAGRLKATDAAVTRFRTGLEGSRAYTLAGRLSLTPSVEVGLRHDGGDAETGAGMDVGAGLVVSDAGTGLAVDVRVRTLLVHQDEDFSERGVAVSLSYNPTPSSPLGFLARVAPSWGGQATSGAQALWGRETMAGMAHGGVAQGNSLDAEVGYGLPVGSRLVGMPKLGLRTSEYGKDYRLGYSLGVLSRESLAFELGVEAQRRESPMMAEGASNGVLGRASLGW